MLKFALLAATGMLAVTPAFAASKTDPVLNHTGGPIPYAQLQQMDAGGYNARSVHKHMRMRKSTAPDAASPSPAAPDQAVSPAPSAPDTAPAAPAAPAPAVTPEAPAVTPPAAPQ